jgi:hypothetical protein
MCWPDADVVKQMMGHKVAVETVVGLESAETAWSGAVSGGAL